MPPKKRSTQAKGSDAKKQKTPAGAKPALPQVDVDEGFNEKGQLIDRLMAW